MQIFDTRATRDALPFGRLVAALADMFATGCEVPQRQMHQITSERGSMLTSLVMPAWTTRYYGVKTVNIAPANAGQGVPTVHAVYTLFDANTGVPLALMDGNEITSRRTAAASALAASKVARFDSRVLLVVGAGRVARLLPQAYRAVLPIQTVLLWARDPVKAEALMGSWRGQGFEVEGATSLPAAVGRADIVSCATLATEPIVQGNWLQEGSHLDLIGSFTPQMREADDACFASAAIFVDTEEAWRKSGDLLGPAARGVIAANQVRGTLAELCQNKVKGRIDPGERTIFKSVGAALEDLAAAILVMQTKR